MRIGIVCKNPRLPSSKRLQEVARRRGHKCNILEAYKFAIHVEEDQPTLFYKKKAIARYDAIIPRVGGTSSAFALAVLRQFEQMGVFMLNHSLAVGAAADKLRTLQTLSRRRIGIPPSSFVYQESDVEAAIERVGGAPVVMKLPEGSQGAGVMLAENFTSAKAMIETLQAVKQKVLLQKFIAESKGKDIRAFVIGDRVAAAMRRIASGDEFRSNYHLGGAVEPIALDPDTERVAVRSAHILGLRVAGVDLVESSNGPLVIEVNSSPGLSGIEEATGIDIADQIISYLEEEVMFPDVVDLRERLSLGKGYGIVEVPVTKADGLAGCQIRAARFREHDVQVLSVTRQRHVLPNPPDDFELVNGDVLICYGKISILKTMLPVKKKRQARKKGISTSAEVASAPES